VFASWLILVSVAYMAGAGAVQRLSAAVGGAVSYVVAAALFAWLLLGETLTRPEHHSRPGRGARRRWTVSS
jgi:drug/metabolite transporter (DMT)-like permease